MEYHKKLGNILFALSFVLVIVLADSCKRPRKYNKNPVHTDFTYDEFAEKLQSVLPPSDSLNKQNYRNLRSNLGYVYQHNDYDPIWLAHGYKADSAAGKFLADLEGMQWDGLNPERYYISRIKKLKEKLGKKTTTIEDAIAFDTLMSLSYITAASDLLFGVLTPKKADSLWFHVNDSSFQAGKHLLAVQRNYVPLDSFRSKLPTYALLREEYKLYRELIADTELKETIDTLKEVPLNSEAGIAFAREIISKVAPWVNREGNDTIEAWPFTLWQYQEYMGIRPTGKADSATYALLTAGAEHMLPRIAANMERIRWMQQDFGNSYILVDVPMMKLFFRINDTLAMQMKVVVGKPERQTPSLFAQMANIVINPPWGVPPTIMKKDVLPGIEKNGKAYLDKKGLKAYDRKGKAVNAAGITAKNYRNYTFKQAPGDDNALGYVKFNLPNPWDIYLHDTPHRLDFGKRERALSSGCIRLHHPQELALFIMNELEKKKLTQEKLDSIIGTHKTQWNVLKQKIPVHIAYLTTYEDSTRTHINYVKDVYKRDAKLIALMPQ